MIAAALSSVVEMAKSHIDICRKFWFSKIGQNKWIWSKSNFSNFLSLWNLNIYMILLSSQFQKRMSTSVLLSHYISAYDSSKERYIYLHKHRAIMRYYTISELRRNLMVKFFHHWIKTKAVKRNLMVKIFHHWIKTKAVSVLITEVLEMAQI